MDDYVAGSVSGLLVKKEKKLKQDGKDGKSDCTDRLFATDSCSDEKVRHSLQARLEKLNSLAKSFQQKNAAKKKRKLVEAVYTREASLREADQGKPKKKKKKVEGSEVDNLEDPKGESMMDSDTQEESEVKFSGETGVESKGDRVTQRRKRKLKKSKMAKDRRTVFVGNLPISATKKTIKGIFKEFGKIESIRFRSAAPADLKLPKKATMIKKEFHEKRNNINAYVVFEEKQSVAKALTVNGMLVDDMHIRVDKTHTGKNPKLSVFVGNLPYDVEEEAVRKHFEDCGDIDGVRIIRDRATGLGKGFGFVLFKDTGAVGLAVRLHDKKFSGRSIRVMRVSLTDNKTNKDQQDLKKSKSGRAGPSKMRMPTNMSSSSFQGLRAKKMTKIKKKLKHKKTVKKMKVKGKRQTIDTNAKRPEKGKKPALQGQ